MTDLDRSLQAMLRERAGDITSMPADLLDLPSLDLPSLDRVDHDQVDDVRAPRRTAWLIAAAVAAVLAIGGASLGIALGSRHTTPTADRRGQAPPTLTNPQRSSLLPATTVQEPGRAVAVPSGPASDVDLSWFGLDAIPGYTVPLRSSDPGVRVAALKRTADTGKRPGNGGLDASAQVLVFDKGSYDPARSALRAGGFVTVGTAKAYFASTPRYVSSRQTAADTATIAWQYAADSWTVVQSITDPTATAADLLPIARAVHPTVDVPIDLPFRLATAPHGRITSIIDNRPGGYSMSVRFEDARTKQSTDFTWSAAKEVSGGDGAVTRSIGGLVGYSSRTGGAGVAYHDGNLTIGVGTDGQATAADYPVLTTILDGLTWANGDGRSPGIPITSAIP